MSLLRSRHRIGSLACAATLLWLSGVSASAQGASGSGGRGAPHDRLDTAAVLASARSTIDEANAAWFPGLQRHDANAVAAAYADSAVFVTGDGTVIKGRAAIARMYAARFPTMRPVRAGGIVQDGLTVLTPTRILEWGHGWLDVEAARAGDPPARTGGMYVTVWSREPDGHWWIVRNLAF